MRTAVVDIGSNSTRLLIAEASREGEVSELVRRSLVTRLGDGVDSSGALSQEAMNRVLAALGEFAQEIESAGVDANVAMMTSAVRDASNGPEFAAKIASQYGLDARILSGDEEARLTFMGAMSGRQGEDASAATPTVVIDIGGGSTEFIVGVNGVAGFHVSVHAGVVRMSERHIHSDPPAPKELQELAADTQAVFAAGLPAAECARVTRGIAVAGTATSAAAMDLELDPYDPARVQGYGLLLATVEMLLARLADMSDAQRRQVVGLDPARAPTIVAGMVLLSQAMRMFDLSEVEVSERDILYGSALWLAARAQA